MNQCTATPDHFLCRLRVPTMSCSADDESTPDHFLCPLTLEVMDDPVQHKVTKHNYERGAILYWIYFGNATCPLTRQPLNPSDFLDNQELQKEICAWRGEEEKSNVSYPAASAPRESRRTEEFSPKKHANKKEKAILKKLQKLRQKKAKSARKAAATK